MSTLTEIRERELAEAAKPKKTKTKAKRDEHGRFIKKAEDTADLDTPSF